MRWTKLELETPPASSPVSELGEVRHGQGGLRLQSKLMFSNLGRNFEDQLFICMRFPVCQGRTRRTVEALLQTVAQ